jgi:hypothetical protein
MRMVSNSIALGMGPNHLDAQFLALKVHQLVFGVLQQPRHVVFAMEVRKR